MYIYFDEYFNVPIEIMEECGAYNISLVNDLPLFIDPILLFESAKKEYRELHDNIIKYLKFLRTKSVNNQIDEKLLCDWYMFPEVKQNWMGYSANGNKRNGLGIKFARALDGNLNKIFTDFGDEKITRGSHLEKLCLFDSGIGKDNISDFATNLIKEYLLEYTEKFSRKYIDRSFLKEFKVDKVRFNYDEEIWEDDRYTLPCKDDDYVILTPIDLLTKDDTFINKDDMYNHIDIIIEEISNSELRDKVNMFLISELSQDMNAEERKKIYKRLISAYPEIMDYYIKIKEEKRYEAIIESKVKVDFSKAIYIDKVKKLSKLLEENSRYYEIAPCSYSNMYKRVLCLKDVIENSFGYKYLYIDNKPITCEYDLNLMFKLLDSRSVDDLQNCDCEDTFIVNYKLASNKKLREYFLKQIKYCNKSNKKYITVIFYYLDKQLEKVNNLCKELGVLDTIQMVLIDVGGSA